MFFTLRSLMINLHSFIYVPIFLSLMHSIWSMIFVFELHVHSLISFSFMIGYRFGCYNLHHSIWMILNHFWKYVTNFLSLLYLYDQFYDDTFIFTFSLRISVDSSTFINHSHSISFVFVMWVLHLFTFIQTYHNPFIYPSWYLWFLLRVLMIPIQTWFILY